MGFDLELVMMIKIRLIFNFNLWANEWDDFPIIIPIMRLLSQVEDIYIKALSK